MLVTDVSNLKPGSHKVVTATCDLQISEKCRGEIKNPYRDMLKYMDSNSGLNVCLPCSRRTKQTGRSNPNFKYDFPDDYLNSIDTESKAYLLGWIASDGHLAKTTVVIQINKKDAQILTTMRNLLTDSLPITSSRIDMVSLSINSLQLRNAVANHLNVSGTKKSYTVQMPELSDQLMWHFLRGYFDGDGSIRSINERKYKSDLYCSIASKSDGFRESLCNFLSSNNIKSWNYGRGSVNMWSDHAYKFISMMYSNSSSDLRLDRKYDRFMEWTNKFNYELL